MDSRVNPQTYIVRVYRFSRDNPRRLVGVVEEIGRKGKKAFTGYQELWEILNTTGRSKSMKSSKRRVGVGGNCSKEREKIKIGRRNV